MLAALLPLISSLGAGSAAAGASGSGLSAILPLLTGGMGGAPSTGKSTGIDAGGILKNLLTGPGSTIGGVKSGLQMINAFKDRRQADNYNPSLQDPMQLAMLDEIQQKRRSIQSGTAYAPQMEDINASQAGVIQGILGAGSGSAATTIQGLLASQSTAGRVKNQIFSQAAGQEQYYSALGTDLMNRISDRTLQLQLMNMSQNRAEWAQGKQDAFANATNAAARFDPSHLVDIFKRNAGADNHPDNVLNPEAQARSLEPLRSILSSDSGLGPVTDTSFENPAGFAGAGLGNTGGIPVNY